ncbi:hypothetical protein ACFSFZ_01850 [Mixta tenebrionis]|uniref:Uncharacterized protein n=1 Tax=Mixta tenebrionis TaxID=2562439 RepID=A0A506V9I4_9GAMM|nr:MULTISPECIES: hypothetical protein [Mixta]QHM77330.1 hypothetical protein C7M52_03326 [Mixta theicola]TPW41950.1 hypothetical protein FKM52_11365 [Mixta tenebrionis]
MSKPPRGIARYDSAVAMVTALSNALHQRPFSSPSQSPTLDRVLPALNLLPDRMREWSYAVGGMTEGVTLNQLQQLDIEGIARWIAARYPQQHYPAVFVGASNGAMVHLAAAMGVPWLPQTFLCPVRSLHNDPDNAQEGMANGKPATDALLATSPHIAVHQMQDPNQGRLMLEQIAWFYLKHRKLPLEYSEFLLSALPPGGTLVINHCTQQWPATRTSDRSFYQFGAPGGATEQEYFQGGSRVAEHLARYGRDEEKWTPPTPDVIVPEAEWGFDAHLMAELKKLANTQGWKLVELRYENPEALSFVTAEIYRDWYMSAGVIASRLVVDSFLLMDPWTTIQQRAIPFWLSFCTEPSANSLQRYLDRQPPFRNIDLMLFSHGTESIGMAPVERWQQLLNYASDEGAFVGVDVERFPRDFAALSRFDRELQQRAPLLPPPEALSTAAFLAGVQRYGDKFQVECLRHN